MKDVDYAFAVDVVDGFIGVVFNVAEYRPFDTFLQLVPTSDLKKIIDDISNNVDTSYKFDLVTLSFENDNVMVEINIDGDKSYGRMEVALFKSLLTDYIAEYERVFGSNKNVR